MPISKFTDTSSYHFDSKLVHSIPLFHPRMKQKSLETTANATRGTAAFNSLHEISTRRRLKFGVKVDETTVLLWMTPRGGRNFNRGESCWVLCEVWKSRERLVN